jgi:L-alanine-DL-glutamate epimerase-like enolase superfamily enzyme
MVMADESCWTPEDRLQVIDARVVDAISAYVTSAGGLFHAIRLAAAVGLTALPCDVSGSIEAGIGPAANLHLPSAH